MLINPVTNLKRCSSCQEEKPATEYNKNAGLKDGLHNQCKPCKKNSWKSPEAIKRSKQKATIRNRFKWSGFTQKDFQDKLLEQNHRCAICQTDDPGAMDWHADHDHSNGQKRGILCRKCNLGISYFDDNLDSLQAAIQYIQHYSR